MDLLRAYASSSDDDGNCGDRGVGSQSMPEPEKSKSKSPRGRKRRRNRGGGAARTKKARHPAAALPIPESVRCLFEGKERTKDSKAHQGRTRSFAHVKGNYPTHVYIPITPSGALERRVTAACTQISTHTRTSCSTQTVERFSPAELHVSLSRAVALRKHQILPFLDALRKAVLGAQRRRVCLELGSGVCIYSNDEKTRSFFAFDVQLGALDVVDLIRATDSALAKFGLPAYYADPTPHVSFAWTLGLPVSMDNKGGRRAVEPPLEVCVDRIECRIGKQVRAIQLPISGV